MSIKGHLFWSMSSHSYVKRTDNTRLQNWKWGRWDEAVYILTMYGIFMYVDTFENKSGWKAKVTLQTIIWGTVMVLFLELFRESGSFFYRWHFLCIKVINTPEISKTYEICKGIIFYKPSLEHALLMVWCISPVANGYEMKISENSNLF